MEYLIQLDYSLFRWVNGALSNSFFDLLMPLLRSKFFWTPVYLFFIAFFLMNFGKKGAVVLLGWCLTFGLADSTSSRLVKNTVQRIRPCRTPELAENLHLRVDCGGGYSFTSSHATNHFAVAVFLGNVLLGLGFHWRWWLLFWAASVSFAQVYVGVHFVGDVLAGALLGSAIGWIVYFIFRENKWLPLSPSN